MHIVGDGKHRYSNRHPNESLLECLHRAARADRSSAIIAPRRVHLLVVQPVGLKPRSQLMRPKGALESAP